MKNDNHLFDFSEYDKDHKCYDIKNKKYMEFLKMNYMEKY